MQKSLSFPRVMKCTAAVTLAATVILSLANRFFPRDWLLPAAISTGTTFYHFAMRLAVGWIVPGMMPSSRHRKWFQQKPFEPKLYHLLRVKNWKDRMPTYAPASFSLRENTLEQIVDNCCVSEAVHEVILLLSFVPLIFSFWWGVFPVFLITSVLAAAIDGSFIIIQRYNRPRLVRILAKKEAKAHE